MEPTRPAREMTTRELAVYIDHSVLKPEFTVADVEHSRVAAGPSKRTDERRRRVGAVDPRA